MMQIKKVMTIIAFTPMPTHIIISGPSAIFGRLLSTTIYGSKILLAKAEHHKSIAIKSPTPAEITKP
jgi:hypothetical protein